MRKDRENLDSLGKKAVAMIDCSTSSDEWDSIGVEQWPSMEAIEEREIFENEVLEVSKYVESKTDQAPLNRLRTSEKVTGRNQHLYLIAESERETKQAHAA